MSNAISKTVLLTDEQDISEVLESEGIDSDLHPDITGVKIESYFNGIENDYQCQLTESPNPCLESDWDCIGYWIE